ncbi:hypothetical protein M413DRAFT_144623 [Hebeloma cylindrosporum]|uniref:Uncharacterized protein n=1 Tax=Hebeloma cylindrosporum TaxID=76867 RepID=A0A0C3CAI2_HEBCY|nr:hypothetical protein M413DRAFT_144623 [Hebeloma cylindrosporum h7]
MTGYNNLAPELIDMVFDELCSDLNSSWSCSDDYEKENIFRSCLPVSTDFRHRVLSRLCSYVFLRLKDAATNVARLREVISQPSNSRLGGD